MAKVRCGGCKKYVDKDSVYRSNGVQNFCSAECSYPATKPSSVKPKPKKKPSQKKPDIPPAVRKAVLERDKHRCRYCRTYTGLHVHHIVYRSQGGEHVEQNLITLCNRHHDLVHSDKKRYMPLCLGVLWLSYIEKRHVTIPQLERFLSHEQAPVNEVR